ncbi:hypothetical protein BDK51DRAFT_34127 [Blyttiomyces helicus]|uniref:Transmembrane protein n=1 Tax=Blyttiomyces helicus TaxID=388810 RepID=A0A4P9WIQ5_9FUNG|nr:hypothetical protein BDK51DRAFT_34127 [Blyttiomyces helicus]|eukprot:RKO92674.1 hypothetical protein BDK51DRAFT_34127 [Blyttiomyces helicus]
MMPIELTLCYVFTGVGFLIQLGNVFYGSIHVIKRPTTFNLVLAVALVMYLLSFMPLVLTTELTVELAGHVDSPDSPLQWKFVRLKWLLRIYSALYSCATLLYLLLVQIRFRVIKTLLPYSDLWDWALVTVTVLIWGSTAIALGVVYPRTVMLQSIAMAIWTAYALVIDNVLSFVFLFQLWNCRRRLTSATSASRGAVRRQQQYSRVVAALIGFCVLSWVGVSLLFASDAVGPKHQLTRLVLFRAAYACTPLDFSGALVFIYTVRQLMVGGDASSAGGSGGSGWPRAGSGPGSPRPPSPPLKGNAVRVSLKSMAGRPHPADYAKLGSSPVSPSSPATPLPLYREAPSPICALPPASSFSK